ncbi:MAG: hypothetical protein ABR987_16745 [Terracidiphilus sp.]|jgi:hypothetical protein
MTPEEKISNIEDQIKLCEKGELRGILCPYCGLQNTETDHKLCCAEMGLVVWAIMRRQATNEVVDSAKRVADAVADMAARNN